MSCLLLVIAAMSAACGGGGAGMSIAGTSGAPALAGAAAGAGMAGSAAGQAGAAVSGTSFADVYAQVISKRCGSCHNDAPSFGGLAFFPGGAATAYANLVGVPAGQEQTYKCRDSGLLRVKPGDPEHSLIYLKLTAPPCGSKMPPAAFGTANDEQVELVRQWIASGAAP